MAVKCSNLTDKKLTSYIMDNKQKKQATKEEYIDYFKGKIKAYNQKYVKEMDEFASILYDMNEYYYNEFMLFLSKQNYKYLLRGIDYIVSILKETQDYEKAAIIVEMGVDRDISVSSSYTNLRFDMEKNNIDIKNLILEKAAIKTNQSKYLKFGMNKFSSKYEDFNNKEIKAYYNKLYNSIPDGLIKRIDNELGLFDAQNETLDKVALNDARKKYNKNHGIKSKYKWRS